MSKQVVIRQTNEFTFDVPAEWEEIINNKEIRNENKYKYILYGGNGYDYELAVCRKEVDEDEEEEVIRFKCSKLREIAETKKVIKKKLD